MIMAASHFRIHIEIVSSQERKLYITRIKNTDAGEYTCIGFLEGNSVKRHVTLRIFSKLTNHVLYHTG